jgi:hypothetical protein
LPQLSTTAGNFEIDFNDGDVRYKCALDYRQCTDVGAIREVFDTMVRAHLSAFERMLPLLEEAATGGALGGGGGAANDDDDDDDVPPSPVA